MSHFEEYVVDDTNKLADGLFELVVSPKPGSIPASPVSTILLVMGATALNNRKGVELGSGATINLKTTDFDRACNHIHAGDVVNYLSDPLPRPVGCALIQNFNFPMSE